MFRIYADGNSIYEPLSDSLALLEPKLTLELGKSGSLSFKVPATHRYYRSLQQLRTFISVKMEDREVFRGRVISNGKDFNNTRAIDCEGDLSFLVDSVQKSTRYQGGAHALFRQLITEHNNKVRDSKKQFQVGTIGVEDRPVLISGESSEIENAETGAFNYKQIAINATSGEWATTYDRIESDLLAYCGGYLVTRRSGDAVYIDWLPETGENATQEIRFGLNMIELEEETTADDLFTVLIPLGDENLTIEKVNGGSNELVNQEAVNKYGRIIKTHVFDNVSNPNTLLENGRRYLASNSEVRTTYTIKAVDLSRLKQNIQSIKVGDSVRIVSEAHGIDERMMCVKIEYDLANPANDNYTFGNPKQTLTERYRKDRRQQGSRSAGGAGAAAAAATKKAEEKTEDKLKDFYNAWVNWDPDTAHVSLGAIYKKLQDAEYVLINQCGIDINGKTGNVNMRSEQHRLNQLVGRWMDQDLKINMIQEADGAKLEHIATELEQLKGMNNKLMGQQASITQSVDTINSRIDILSTSVGENHDNLAQVTTAANQYGSFVEILAKGIFNKSAGEITEQVEGTAQILAKVTNLGSQISLKADKVTVDGILSAIQIESDYVNVKKGIYADYVSSRGNIYASGHVYETDPMSFVNTRLANVNHTHQFIVDGDRIYITDTEGDKSSYFFNIADTNKYKTDVSAAHNAGAQTARIDSVTLTTVNAHRVIGSGHYIDLQIDGVARGTYDDGTYYTSDSLRISNGRLVDAGTVYSAGYNAGYVAAPGDQSGSVYCTSVNVNSNDSHPHTGQYGTKYLNVVVHLSNSTSWSKSVYYTEK